MRPRPPGAKPSNPAPAAGHTAKRRDSPCWLLKQQIYSHSRQRSLQGVPNLAGDFGNFRVAESHRPDHRPLNER